MLSIKKNETHHCTLQPQKRTKQKWLNFDTRELNNFCCYITKQFLLYILFEKVFTHIWHFPGWCIRLNAELWHEEHKVVQLASVLPLEVGLHGPRNANVISLIIIINISIFKENLDIHKGFEKCIYTQNTATHAWPGHVFIGTWRNIQTCICKKMQ